MEKATSLDEVLIAHDTYLTKVLQRCLLHEKVGLVREAVVKVLNMALVYQRRWDAGIHTFRYGLGCKYTGMNMKGKGRYVQTTVRTKIYSLPLH